MNALIAKLISWIPKNLAGILGIIQAVIKFGKEVATLALDIVAPLIPGDKDEKVIETIRDIFNTADGWVEKIKSFLLQVGVD